MSDQTIRKRAADIRRSWTKSERRQRAIAGERRRLDLLVRIAMGAAWPSKQPA